MACTLPCPTQNPGLSLIPCLVVGGGAPWNLLLPAPVHALLPTIVCPGLHVPGGQRQQWALCALALLTCFLPCPALIYGLLVGWGLLWHLLLPTLVPALVLNKQRHQRVIWALPLMTCLLACLASLLSNLAPGGNLRNCLALYDSYNNLKLLCAPHAGLCPVSLSSLRLISSCSRCSPFCAIRWYTKVFLLCVQVIHWCPLG